MYGQMLLNAVESIIVLQHVYSPFAFPRAYFLGMLNLPAEAKAARGKKGMPPTLGINLEMKKRRAANTSCS